MDQCWPASRDTDRPLALSCHAVLPLAPTSRRPPTPAGGLVAGSGCVRDGIGGEAEAAGPLTWPQLASNVALNNIAEPVANTDNDRLGASRPDATTNMQILLVMTS